MLIHHDQPISTGCHLIHFPFVFRILSSLSTFHPVVFLSCLNLFVDLSVEEPSENTPHHVFPASTRLLFVYETCLLVVGLTDEKSPKKFGVRKRGVFTLLPTQQTLTKPLGSQIRRRELLYELMDGA